MESKEEAVTLVPAVMLRITKFTRADLPPVRKPEMSMNLTRAR
jgi:hypothetical protein